MSAVAATMAGSSGYGAASTHSAVGNSSQGSPGDQCVPGAQKGRAAAVALAVAVGVGVASDLTTGANASVEYGVGVTSRGARRPAVDVGRAAVVPDANIGGKVPRAGGAC